MFPCFKNMHLAISMYCLFSIAVSNVFEHSIMTTILYILLTILIQLFYFSIFSYDEKLTGPFCQCPSCGKLTPQSYIHCTKCRRCVPVLHQHWCVSNTCTSKENILRYTTTLKIFITTNIFVTFIQLHNYPPAFFLLCVHLFALKSTYSSLQKDI